MIPMSIFPLDIVDVGEKSYGELNVVSFNDKSRLVIGNYVSIAQKVFFILDGEHSLNTISTFPFRSKALGDMDSEATSKGNIVIGDDVWIGFGSIILSGVQIGQGAVVAAGSVVTRNVDPYTIVGGTPAREIKKRFDETQISHLMNIDYKRLSRKLVSDHIKELYVPYNNPSQIEWMPRKGTKAID